MKPFFFRKEQSCVDKIAEVYASKCKDSGLDMKDCQTSVTISNIANCDHANFPDKGEIESALRKLKGLDRAAYVNADTSRENFPYLVIRTAAYE